MDAPKNQAAKAGKVEESSRAIYQLEEVSAIRILQTEDAQSTTTIAKSDNDSPGQQSQCDLANTDTAHADSSKTPVYSVFPKRIPLHHRHGRYRRRCLPISGNIFLPALNALSTELHVSSSLINISLPTYLITQGLAPSFIGNLADTIGRRPAYLIGFAIWRPETSLNPAYESVLVAR